MTQSAATGLGLHLRSASATPFSLRASASNSPHHQSDFTGKHPGFSYGPASHLRRIDTSRHHDVSGPNASVFAYRPTAPASPPQSLTPGSPDNMDGEFDSQLEEPASADLNGEEPSEDSEDRSRRSAGDLSAQDRKMRRFRYVRSCVLAAIFTSPVRFVSFPSMLTGGIRLTHSQTRFLMSEFARQAHPDAAQRERLSREIPGLSPRQVQVWFQNRYAHSHSHDRNHVRRH